MDEGKPFCNVVHTTDKSNDTCSSDLVKVLIYVCKKQNIAREMG